MHLRAVCIAVAKGGTMTTGKDEGKGAQGGRELGVEEGIVVWIFGEDGGWKGREGDGLVGGGGGGCGCDTAER